MNDNALTIDKNQAEYPILLEQYLTEAQDVFGPKTEYNFGRLDYHNQRPMVILSERMLMEDFKKGFDLYLKSQALLDRKDGIFQLAHEVVHLLSPVEQDEDEVNYLEEGMAVYFSKMITERETGDSEYCDKALEKQENYKRAYDLYCKLIEIDPYAVKKVRQKEPVIGALQPNHFMEIGILDEALLEALLAKF